MSSQLLKAPAQIVDVLLLSLFIINRYDRDVFADGKVSDKYKITSRILSVYLHVKKLFREET